MTLRSKGQIYYRCSNRDGFIGQLGSSMDGLWVRFYMCSYTYGWNFRHYSDGFTSALVRGDVCDGKYIEVIMFVLSKNTYFVRK